MPEDAILSWLNEQIGRTDHLLNNDPTVNTRNPFIQSAVELGLRNRLNVLRQLREEHMERLELRKHRGGPNAS